ncbi:MAG: amidophosphoribosyltransferase, partial [Kiritimatiellia bacterium]
MVIFDGWNNNARKGMGLVNEVFKGDFDEELPGSTGIGHVRYSTTGRSCEQNIQPLTAECRDGNWAIAHNGNLVNAAELREAYQRRGAIFQTSTDSEILLHQLADPRYLQLPNRLPALFTQLQGSFAFVLLNNGKVYAARDPWGIRPLSIGRLGDGYVLSSETCVFTQLGIDYLRDVEPGEFICIDHTGLHSTRFDESVGQAVGQCVFEHIYFARPDSVVF